MNCNRNLSHLSRIWMIIMLSASLIHSTLWALKPVSAAAPDSARNAQNPQPAPRQLQEHQSRQLLIKMFQEVTPQTEQVLNTFGSEYHRLRGSSNVFLLTVKDQFDFNSTISTLQQFDKVIEWVEPNYVVKSASLAAARSAIPNDPRFPTQWGLDNRGQNGGARGSDIGVRAGWQITAGSRQTIIAVIDTGVDLSHPDLRRNLWANTTEAKGSSNEDDDHNGYVDDVRGWNFVNDSNDVGDDQGHGTMVAGIIAAEGNNAKGISGVMQKASVMPLKALDASGNGTVANVVEAIDFAAAHQASIINCSFGTPANSRALLEAINRASIKGVIVVAAAGNDGKDLAQTPFYPASYETGNLISVTATTNGDLLPGFSNWNSSKVLLAAPGEDILTTGRGGGYASLSGTSASAAFVSGVTGLLKTVRGWASVQNVRHSLVQTARRVTALKDKVASGGVINAAEALSVFKAGNGKANDKRITGNSKNRKPSPKPKAAVQSTNNLDTLRNNLPQPPNAYAPSGIPAPTGYEDPKPVITANYAGYLTQMTQSYNPSGPAGALPLQAADPTAAGASVGGVTVFLDSKQYSFTAPVLSLAGRAGSNVSLGLSYSSKVWIKDPVTNTMVFNADRGFPAPGWRTGFGAIQIKDLSGPYLNTITGKSSIIYLEPNGVRRDLAQNYSTGIFESYDSSYLKFDATAQVLYFPNGTQMKFGAYSYSTNNRDYQALPVQIKDSNGNYVDIYYKTLDNEKVVIDYFVDTAGRRVDFGYQNNRLIWIGQNRAGTWCYFARIDYLPVTIQPHFDSSLALDPSTINNTQVWLPSRITYPTGINFRFVYNGYGQMMEMRKFVPTISGQGTERQVALTSFTEEPLNDPPTDCPRFTYRSESAENWQDGTSSLYNYNSRSSVIDPANRRFSVTINGLEHRLEMVPPGYGAEGKIEYTTYEQDAGLTYLSNPRVIERKTFFTQYATQALARKTRYSYSQMNGIWLETIKDDYNGESSVYRRTTTEYTSYPARNILGLPTNISVYAGPGTTLMSRTSNTYDETGTYQDSNNQTASYFIDASADSVIQHDNQNYGAGLAQRGNLTSVTQHSVVNGAINGSRIIRRASYDTNGNRRAEADGALNRQQFNYADYYSNKPAGIGQTHVYLNTSANPHGFKTGSQYDYFNGNVVKSFNQRPGSSDEEQPMLTTYDFADRWVERLRGDGGWMRMRYWDNWLAGVKVQKLDVSGGTDQVHASFELFDGTGRVWRKANDHPDGVGGKYSGQALTFDNMGHRSASTSFIAVNSEWTPGWEDAAGWQTTNASHDQFDRTTLLTRPDGNNIQYNYNGCSCAGSETKTVTDETGCKTRTITDTFGRVESVSELDSAAGNPMYGQVTYGYDVLDRLVSITHAKAGGAQYQTRTFVYDGYGRLASETNPESGTISYTYKPNDMVESVSNERGMVASYSYNTRNLVTQVSYNDGGATPASTFGYDDFGSRTSMSDGEGQTTYAYTIHRQMQSETRTFGNLPTNSFKLNYTWSLADQVKSVNSQIIVPGGGGGAPFTQTDSKHGATNVYTISGTVRDPQNQPIPQTTITLSGGQSGQTATNSQGQYSFANLAIGGNYTLTPSKPGYVFSPSSRTYNNLNSDKTAADFTGNLSQQTTFNKTISYARSNVGSILGIGTNLIGSDPNATGNVTSAMTYRAWNAYLG